MRPILITSSAAAAISAQQIVGQVYHCVAPADLTGVSGASVLLWPDSSAEYIDAMQRLAQGLTGQAAEVKIIDPIAEPGGINSGWGPIDAAMSGWEWEKFRAWAKPRLSLVVPNLPTEQSTESPPIELYADVAISAKPRRQQAADIAMFDTAVSLTESNLATAFVRRFGGDLRYDHTRGKWLVWSGTHWQVDGTRMAFDWVRRFTATLNHDDKARWAKASVFKAVETIAEADRAFACVAADFDRDLWLMGTPGGVLDLRTGDTRPARPDDMISKIAGCAPAGPGVPAPKWNDFLMQATDGDEELILFLRQICGYALTGDINEHILVFIFGPGGNGKGVFMDTITGVLGQYAQVAAMSTFTATKNEKHPTEIAHLNGARLVMASETESGQVWAEARIKQLTGGDKVRARFLYREEFEFLPQLKLVIVGNHKPRIQTVDEAMRRRLNLIDFKHKPASPNPMLRHELQAEYPQILRWCIDGCLDWQKNGFVRPDCVKAATEEYFSEQDLVKQWVAECCECEPRFSAPATMLFKEWSKWAKSSGEEPGTQMAFGEKLTQMGIYTKKKTAVVLRVGIRLITKPIEDPRNPGEWDG